MKTSKHTKDMPSSKHSSYHTSICIFFILFFFQGLWLSNVRLCTSGTKSCLDIIITIGIDKSGSMNPDALLNLGQTGLGITKGTHLLSCMNL